MAPQKKADVWNVHLDRIYRDTDSDLPSDQSDFQVAKYSIFEKVKEHFCSLPLMTFPQQ